MRRARRHPIVSGVVGFLVLLFVVAGIAGSGKKKASESPRTSVATSNGTDYSRHTGPLDAFNACVATHPLLSTAGKAIVNGSEESVLDQLRGIVGGVQLDASHHMAQEDAKVMTGFPVRIVRGSYVVTVNQDAGGASKAIQACAPEISPA